MNYSTTTTVATTTTYLHPSLQEMMDMLPNQNPESMAAICKEWSLPSANDIVMVGDSVSNDIVFGKNAGSWTALLDIHGNQHTKEPKADFCRI